MRKPKATWDDFYERLTFHRYKTGPKMIEELEADGFRTGQMCDAMYYHLRKWEREGLVESREKALTEEQLAKRGGYAQKEYKLTPGSPQSRRKDASTDMLPALA